jgi:hypothetical protein
MVGKGNTFVVVLGFWSATYINRYAAIPLVAGLIKIGMLSGPAQAFVNARAVSFVALHHCGLCIGKTNDFPVVLAAHHHQISGAEAVIQV